MLYSCLYVREPEPLGSFGGRVSNNAFSVAGQRFSGLYACYHLSKDLIMAYANHPLTSNESRYLSQRFTIATLIEVIFARQPDLDLRPAEPSPLYSASILIKPILTYYHNLFSASWFRVQKLCQDNNINNLYLETLHRSTIYIYIYKSCCAVWGRLRKLF